MQFELSVEDNFTPDTKAVKITVHGLGFFSPFDEC